MSYAQSSPNSQKVHSVGILILFRGIYHLGNFIRRSDTDYYIFGRRLAGNTAGKYEDGQRQKKSRKSHGRSDIRRRLNRRYRSQ